MSDPGQSPSKLSQVSNVNDVAYSAKTRPDCSHYSQRVTSADKVKVSSPISYKTKTYLDNVSLRSFNSQKSTRRQRGENNSSHLSARTFES